jgi:hypothetical protein
MKTTLIIAGIAILLAPAASMALDDQAAEAMPVVFVPDPLPDEQAAALETLEHAWNQAGAKAIWLVDDFEDGNLTEWFFLGGSCSGSVTTATAFQGTHSMLLSGDCGNSYVTGYLYDLVSFKATGIALAIRPGSDTETDAFFAVGDDSMLCGGDPVIELKAAGNGYWVVRGPGIYWAVEPYDAHEWYDIWFVLDWGTRTYDIWVNGSPEMTDVPFVSDTASTLTTLHLTNIIAAPTSGTETWWDDIVLSTPPPVPPVFIDGFESGDCSHWSSSTDGC